MSFPRRFKIHAISYRELIRCTCAPFSFITSRILPNLEAVVSPLYSSVKIHTFSVGSCGLSVQISFTRSFATDRLPCFFSAIFAYAAPSALESTLPSKPITPPCGSLSSTNSSKNLAAVIEPANLPALFFKSATSDFILLSVHLPQTYGIM